MAKAQTAVQEGIQYESVIPETIEADHPRGAEMVRTEDGYNVRLSFSLPSEYQHTIQVVAVTYATVSELAKQKGTNNLVLQPGQKIGLWQPWEKDHGLYDIFNSTET